LRPPGSREEVKPEPVIKTRPAGPVWHALGVAAPEIGALLPRHRHGHDREARGFTSPATG
jgi:hypothetical protein